MSELIHPHESSPNHNEALISDASPIRDDDRIPPGYSFFRREVRLLNGQTEPVYYSIREDQTTNPLAWEHSSPSVVEVFSWILQVPEFADQQTEDDDRALEIGNMMSYALRQGLTEEQVIECYKQAFTAADEQGQ